MKNKSIRIVEEIDITIRHNGKESIHEIYFDIPGEELTEDEMYEIGFAGDIILEEESGEEIELHLEADNADWFKGTKIDGLAFNLYKMEDFDWDERCKCDFAEVVAFKPIFTD